MMDWIFSWIWGCVLHLWKSFVLSLVWGCQVWRSFLRGGVVFLVIVMVLMAPWVIYQVQVTPAIFAIQEKPPVDWDEQEKERLLRYAMIVSCLWILMTTLLPGVLLFGVQRSLLGRRTSFLETIDHDFGPFSSMLGTGFLVTSAILVGLTCFLFPGLIFLACFFVAVPCVVEERVGWVQALVRSYDLTHGYWITIWFLLFFLQLPLLLLSLVVGSWLGAGWGPFLFQMLLSVLGAGLQGTASALVYIQLRMGKDGFALEMTSDDAG